MKFNSIFSDLLVGHVEAKGSKHAMSYVKVIVSVLVSFDAYCVKTGHISEDLTQDLVSGWLSQQLYRSRYRQAQCRTTIRRFAIYLLENGRHAYVLPVLNPKVQPAEATFESCLGEFIVGLLNSKHAHGYKYGPLNEYRILIRIDAFCISEGLEGDELPRWLVEKWSERTENEGAKSRSNRIVVIRQLALHMIAQGRRAYIAEAARVPHNPFPYVPDKKEMSALLIAIDSQKNRSPWSDCAFPVLFRLLLASGIRISEACSLKAGCVEVHPGSHCTINIINAKGHKDRRIYLSGEILTLLKEYDKKMTFMMPGREWFFPGDYRPLKEHLSPSTARKHFSRAREVVYGQDPRRRPSIHSLRHAYIIWTLRRWREENLNIDEMLPYLSKHLGHSSIQETFAYYNHYGHDYEHIRKDSDYFEVMVPEVCHEE